MDDNTTVIDIRKEVEARRKQEQERFGGNGSGSGGDGITSEFVLDCLHANELGDGILYATIHQNRFVFDTSAEQWMAWSGHFWDRDEAGRSLAAVEDVAIGYLKAASDLLTQTNGQNGNPDYSQQVSVIQSLLYRRAKRLRSERGRNACLKFARTNKENPLIISGNKFDQNPWLLACQNGVIDLRTGDLHPGRPGDHISKACPHEWKGIDEPAPLWETLMYENFEGKEELILYMGRLLGYALTGLTTEHILPVLWGQGRNGKGTIVETVKYVLGPLAAPIQMEMLLDQGRAKSSAGPSPDIMSLRGLRMAFTSESDEGRRISPAKVKWLSGGDTLVGRNPHDRYEIHFNPTHTLFLLTNNKPSAPADDFAFWERVHLIPFNLSYVDREPQAENERKADKTLPERLKSEASGILAWLVRGCILWQQHGLNPPFVVREATEQYRRDEDILGDFIDECLDKIPTAETTAADLYNCFKKWWEENINNRPWTVKKFGKLMSRRFKKEKRGVYIYYGITIKRR